jgi:hypothetical protein
MAAIPFLVNHERDELVSKQNNQKDKVKTQTKKRCPNGWRQNEPWVGITAIDGAHFLDIARDHGFERMSESHNVSPQPNMSGNKVLMP